MTWLKQTKQQPLYPDLLWSRPERRDQAGKLVIVGGNQYGFSAVGTAFAAASTAGIGVSRVLLPNKLKSTVSAVFPEAEFVPSTPSGSFARSGLADWLEAASWGDAVLLAGDFGHNSETALLVEAFWEKYSGTLTLCQDAIEYVLARPTSVVNRPSTTLVLSMGQLQKLVRGLHGVTAVTQAMGLPELASWTEQFTREHALSLVTRHLDHIVVAYRGNVSTTPDTLGQAPWRVQVAAMASVWGLQHPSQVFEATTSAVIDL